MKMDEIIDKKREKKLRDNENVKKNILADICCTTHSYEKKLCQIWEELILKSRNLNGGSKRNENWLKYKKCLNFLKKDLLFFVTRVSFQFWFEIVGVFVCDSVRKRKKRRLQSEANP